MSQSQATTTQLSRNLARLPQEMLDAVWAQYMRTPGVHVLEYHYWRDDELEPRIEQRRKELDDMRRGVPVGQGGVDPVWGPAPQIEERRCFGDGYFAEHVTVPRIHPEFQRASRYMRDRVVGEISAAMREQFEKLCRFDETITAAEVRELAVHWKPEDWFRTVKVCLRPKEDLVVLLRPLLGFGLARLPDLSKWATPEPAEHVDSDMGLIEHNYPVLEEVRDLAMVFDPAIHRRNCHGCKLLGLHYQGMQDEARRHREEKHVRETHGLPKPKCRMCADVYTRLAKLPDADKTPDRLPAATQAIRDDLLRSRRLLMNLVPNEEKRRRSGCDYDPSTHTIRDFAVHSIPMDPLPSSPGSPGWPWRGPKTPPHGYDLYEPEDDDDDTTSICSLDLPPSAFARYNHSHRKQLIDATPIRYTHDYALLTYNTDQSVLHLDAPAQIRSLPVTQNTLLDLHPSSFNLPATDDDPDNPTLRQFHDRDTPMPKHGTHPECRRQGKHSVVPYDTDLAQPWLLPIKFPKCQTLYMIDYSIGLRPGQTTIPLEGMAHWNDDDGGLYVEVDPNDKRWEIRRGDECQGDIVEFVEYLRHCWDAAEAVNWSDASRDVAEDEEAGERSAKRAREWHRKVAVMAYVRVGDLGRHRGLLPGGGIGDGVGLPREEMVRMRVERTRKGMYDSYDYVKDEEGVLMFSTRGTGYFYEFRGVEDELDPDRKGKPESWYLGDVVEEPWVEEEEGEEEEGEDEEGKKRKGKE